MAFKWVVCKQAILAFLWSLAGPICQNLFWTFFRLISEGFKFAHEFCEKVLELAIVPATPTTLEPALQELLFLSTTSPMEHESTRSPECSQSQQRHSTPPSQFDKPITGVFDPKSHIPQYGCRLPTQHHTTKWYAVARGRNPGVYRCWERARQQVDGFSCAMHKAFKSREEAEHWFDLRSD